MGEHPQQGRVIAAHGRHYRVELVGGETRHCYTRGKKAGPAVGDHVHVLPEGHNEGVILDILPRRNLLYRADATRSKQFAANLDQLLLVVAPEPAFSDDLLGRALVAASSARIPVRILLNKTDLASTDAARTRLAPIAALGVPILELCALHIDDTRSRLMPLLQDRSTLLLGQSGMGKSTLLNALIPEAAAATQMHSEALGTGKHTTTQTRIYKLSGGGDLIDSPGFQAFGLQHLGLHEIEQGFPEFAPVIKHCRFYNCTHRHEPGCGVLAAVTRGEITPARHALYQRILAENEAARKW